MLRGVSQVSLDAKGRFAVPQRHRDALGIGDTSATNTLVMTADPSRCLLLYSIAAWEPIEQKLMALSSFNSSTRALQRLLVGHADDVDVDATGRLLVPPALRQYAALDKRIVLVGQGNKFEIWDETRWHEVTAAAVSFSEGGLPPELDGFSL
ncbi:MAG: division/cell wall cluster transcriptional repressor MraZ [Betaproteobacteria bacterium]